ncbi:hypothetical protein GGS21DRAFT_513143 [Xylaria nigripes]|nr:hypothetical protein GGS21DRAFT_513143 [Xylaria nigripes]
MVAGLLRAVRCCFIVLHRLCLPLCCGLETNATINPFAVRYFCPTRRWELKHMHDLSKHRTIERRTYARGREREGNTH